MFQPWPYLHTCVALQKKHRRTPLHRLTILSTLHPPSMEAFWRDDPKALRAAAFALLADGANRRHSPLHTLSLASMAQDGSPDIRTVVFRGFHEEHRQCRMHTDIRSPKVAALRDDPRAVLLWYAPEWKLQLRARAYVAIHHRDTTTAHVWESSDVRSRRTYSAPFAPGSPTPHPVTDLAPHLLHEPATEENTAAGYEHFAVLLATFHHLEWLVLSSNGNRRGCFLWQQDAWQHQWLAP